MHPFSVRPDGRATVLRRFMATAIFLYISISALVLFIQSRLPSSLEGWASDFIAGIAKPAAVVTVLIIAFRWVDKSGWKNTWVRKALDIRNPVLEGDWNVSGTSSHSQWNGTATIEQTWSAISICLDVGQSVSQSKIAGMDIDSKAFKSRITYEYENSPKAGAPDTMFPHFGVATLDFNRSGPVTEISGTYYTDPQYRRTWGSFTATRSS